MCPNRLCQNRRNWILTVEHSKVVDWQRVRVQENSSEIPAGSMPRRCALFLLVRTSPVLISIILFLLIGACCYSLDIVLRNEIVDRARPGDKCVFTGNLIVVPDVGQLGAGRSAEMRGVAKSKSKDAMPADGMTGLKALGVRDLSYKLCFLSSMVQPADARVGFFYLYLYLCFLHLCREQTTNQFPFENNLLVWNSQHSRGQ